MKSILKLVGLSLLILATGCGGGTGTGGTFGSAETLTFEGWDLYRRGGDDAKSEELFKNALSLDPNFSEAHNGLGWLNFRKAGQATGEAQASLLAGLDAPANVVAFRFTPALGVTVSGADLARLRTLPEVLNIQEDLPVPADDTRLASPMLDQSTVLVGATAAHAMGYDGTGYEVAILDTGIESSRLLP